MISDLIFSALIFAGIIAWVSFWYYWYQRKKRKLDDYFQRRWNWLQSVKQDRERYFSEVDAFNKELKKLS
ncbi:MAG: hypothetical protein ACFFDN_24900 [Candidatus Hodarchaeota archaeon]